MLRLHNRSAFTLIELLIVVAIIGILAAIAIPNFLNAQVRAKVSRAEAEMRNMAIALESYHVDFGVYPPAGDESDLRSTPAEPFEGYLSTFITTPISYVSTLSNEIFPNKSDPGAPENLPFHYSEFGTNSLLGEPEFVVDINETVYGSRNNSLLYLMFSHGPDLDHDEDEPAPYDPTNGTVSSGDIYYWGPGLGLARR